MLAEINEHLPRAVKVIETAHGKVDPAVLLGLRRRGGSRS